MTKEEYRKYLHRSALVLIGSGIAFNNNFEEGRVYEISYKVRCENGHLKLIKSADVKSLEDGKD